MPTPINFILNEFSSDLSLYLGAALPGQYAPGLGFGYNAVYEVDTQVFRDVFQIHIDAYDVTDSLFEDVNIYEDIKYYVDVNHYKNNTNIKNWPSTYILNTCNACTTYPDNIDTTFTTDIDGSRYSKEKTLVKHDYIRWLGFKLFSSLHSSGLFSNESQMNEELAEQGERLFYEYIKFKLDYISTQSTHDCMFLDEVDDTTNSSNLNADNKVDANYLTNHTDEKYNGFGIDDGYGPSSNEVVNNITKTLFEQIIKTQPERFQNINSGQNPPFGPNSAIDPERTRSGENTLDSSYNRIPLPFAAGDSITFNITILPSLGQSQITSDPFLTDEDLYRTYHIKLLLTDEPINNPIPNQTITTYGYSNIDSSFNDSYIS